MAIEPNVTLQEVLEQMAFTVRASRNRVLHLKRNYDITEGKNKELFNDAFDEFKSNRDMFDIALLESGYENYPVVRRRMCGYEG